MLKEKEQTNNIKIKLIFSFIKEYGPISRAKLSYLTGMSPPTIGKYVDKLIKQGQVAEVERDKLTGGRHAGLLALNPDFGPALGIEVGGSQLRWVISNLGGKVFESGVQVVGEGKILDVLEQQIETLLLRQPEIKAIGVAIVGIAETLTGILVCSPHRPDMDGLPLKKHLEEKFRIPVFIDDVTRSSAIAEWQLGVAQGEKDFVYLYLDEGIGLSFVSDGKIYQGAYGISGEIGHFIIDENGPRCGCGNRGCLEVFASCKAIILNVQKALQGGVFSTIKGKEITIDNIILEAQNGDKLCYRIINEAGEKIGMVMAQVLNFTGIPVIVVGGCLKEAGKILIEPIKRMIKTNSLSALSKYLDVRVSSLGVEAGATGSAIQSLMELVSNSWERVENYEKLGEI